MFVAIAWLLGALGSLTSVTAIWLLRFAFTGTVYVSGLGAQGESTAGLFNTALLTLGVSGVLLALSLRHVERRNPRPVAPRAASLAHRMNGSVWQLLTASGFLFVVASRVPCSRGCPVPGSADFTFADAVHLTAAISGFVLACLAMLIVASTSRRGSVRVTALVACVLVAATSSTGGLLALFAPDGHVGAWLEFAAMTLAVLWLVTYVSSRTLSHLTRFRAGEVFGRVPSRSMTR